MRLNPIHLSTVAITALIFVASGCGAPLKRADQVKYIFSNSTQLNEKVTTLCNILRGRNAIPDLNGIGLANDVCTKAGSRPLNYKDMQKSVGFSVVDSDAKAVAPGTNKPLLTIRTRSELWLNTSILALAQILFEGLKNKTDNVVGSNGGSGQSQNKDFSFQIIGKPSFDSQTWQLDLRFSIATTKVQNGLVDLNNEFRVTGILFDQKYFAAVAETVSSQPVEKSLLESGKFLIVLVPHAGDIFIDLTSDLRFHSFDVDAVMKKTIVDFLGPGLKSIPDLLTGLTNSNSSSSTTTSTTTTTSATLR